jgi:hypothetical protein
MNISMAKVIASPMLLAPIKARASTIKRPKMMATFVLLRLRVLGGGFGPW